ncbi:hypothetical protein [Kribbella sp. NPDC049584]|uniref:hypothetical protein n=1 Tax=Kribbella sp. NPDC049584 TaxID=3154833 RepID=UPI00341AEC43
MSLYDEIFALTPAIRYVAHGDGQQVDLRSRPGLDNASADESDRYEELLVNPTLLTLTRQRGEIDCGGLRYLIIGYGNFSQLVLPMTRGHLSVAFELAAYPADYAQAIIDIGTAHGL